MFRVKSKCFLKTGTGLTAPALGNELKTLGTFGLKSKRELWKAHTELSRVRHQARSLLALRQNERQEKERLKKSSTRVLFIDAVWLVIEAYLNAQQFTKKINEGFCK